MKITYDHILNIATLFAIFGTAAGVACFFWLDKKHNLSGEEKS